MIQGSIETGPLSEELKPRHICSELGGHFADPRKPQGRWREVLEGPPTSVVVQVVPCTRHLSKGALLSL